MLSEFTGIETFALKNMVDLVVTSMTALFMSL